MRRIFLILFAIFVLVVSAGLYQGWFTVSSRGGNQGGKTNFNLEIDSGKMKEDANSLSTRAKELTDNVTEDNRVDDSK